MTESLFDLAQKAIDSLYVVNDVMPEVVDDEVVQELNKAIKACEKIYDIVKPMDGFES